MIDNIHEQERQHLNELMAEADLFSKHSIKHSGKVHPTLFMHGVHGKAMFAPDDMSNEQAKDAFAAMARLVCIAHGADATVFVSEAWTRFAKEGEKLDVTKLPSRCPDRQEVVVMMGQTRNTCQQRMLPMERSANGKFLGFGEARIVDADRLEGRFSNFMPEEYPNAQSRDVALEALAKLGVMVNKRENQREERRERGRGLERGL